jgi:5-methylcytosine-specific restriction endonuclease McrA
MRFLNFVEPNFMCEVVDPGGNLYEKWLFFADTEEKLKTVLQSRLLQARVVTQYTFTDWRGRAGLEAKRANKARNKEYEYKQTLWSEIKQYLFYLSNNKCGYCEANVRVTSSGHVEHYRPKKKVEENSKHPGYYWLAYEIDNYIPCCENCNSARGKRNHFPLVDENQRAKGPKGLAAEEPLLLNPFKEDPSEHIRFIGPEDPLRFGQLEGTTPKGKASVKIYNLNRGDLVRDRQTAYRAIKDRLDLAKARPQVRERILEEYKSGECEYYIMVEPVLTDWFRERELIERAKIEKASLALKALQNELEMLRST